MDKGLLDVGALSGAEAADGSAKRATLDAYFRKYFPELVRFLCKRGREPDQAADIAQTAFERLIARIDRPQELEHPRSLLLRIARNVLIDLARKEQTRRAWFGFSRCRPRIDAGAPRGSRRLYRLMAQGAEE